jgi:hypothetical protein
MRLPDSQAMASVNNSFGKRGVAGYTRSTVQRLIAFERAGRLMRGSQVLDNCQVSHWEDCAFTVGQTTPVESLDFLDFAQIRFTEKPAFSTGSQSIGTGGLPGMAEVAAWRINSRGHYTGARLKYWALGTSVAPFRVAISASFSGPAIRTGG